MQSNRQLLILFVQIHVNSKKVLGLSLEALYMSVDTVSVFK